MWGSSKFCQFETLYKIRKRRGWRIDAILSVWALRQAQGDSLAWHLPNEMVLDTIFYQKITRTDILELGLTQNALRVSENKRTLRPLRIPIAIGIATLAVKLGFPIFAPI